MTLDVLHQHLARLLAGLWVCDRCGALFFSSSSITDDLFESNECPACNNGWRERFVESRTEVQG